MWLKVWWDVGEKNVLVVKSIFFVEELGFVFSVFIGWFIIVGNFRIR